MQKKLTKFHLLANVFLQNGRQVNVIIFLSIVQAFPTPQQHAIVGADQKVQERHEAGSTCRRIGLDAKNAIPQGVGPVKGIVVVVAWAAAGGVSHGSGRSLLFVGRTVVRRLKAILQ
jgi:hypothetical protein